MYLCMPMYYSLFDYCLILQIFYAPLALVVPPSIFCVHYQFNTLYQFWIHTEIVRSIGPLEYILNTPSHHRVHHGNLMFFLDCVQYLSFLLLS